jgi:hypothetical protein
MAFPALRQERIRARGELELLRLRAERPSPHAAVEDALKARLRLLTDELVARYASDLGLVDSLLEPAYARKATASSGQEHHASGQEHRAS